MRQKHGWVAILAACAVVLTAGGLPAQDNKAVDKQLADTLRAAINRSADIYTPTASAWNGCYRLYEGARRAIRPSLPHRPDLQKAIDTGLATAARNANVQRRAFDLREVIDRIRSEVGGKAMAGSLWERLGG